MRIFPESWKICEADTVCAEVVDCVNKTAPVVDANTGFRMIRTTNVRDGRVDLSETRFVEAAVFQKWTRRVLPRRGDIILTREAPLGEVGLLRSDENVFLGQRTMLYRADPKKLNQQFLYYSLLGPYVQGQIRGQGSGATVEHLRVPDAEKLAIPVAPLKAQKNIAAILSAYDDLIENNRCRIALLEKMAEEIYREWFVRMRFPGHEQVKFKKWVPEGWRAIELRKACSLIKRGITPSYNDSASTLIINQKCIRQGVVDLAEARRHETNVPSEKIVRYGDVLINSTGVGTLGRVAVFDHEDEEVTCDTHVTICRADTSMIDLHYLGHAVRPLQTYFENMAVGSTGQAELGRDIIGGTKILLPTPEVQQSFKEVVEPIWKAKRLFARKLKALTESRDALLPRLISGKLGVENLDIQFPPSMLDTPSPPSPGGRGSDAVAHA